MCREYQSPTGPYVRLCSSTSRPGSRVPVAVVERCYAWPISANHVDLKRVPPSEILPPIKPDLSRISTPQHRYHSRRKRKH